MTSLTAATHAAHAAAPAFNGLFYATAATIIPVLFLAIAVQGPAYQNLLKALNAADRRQERHTTAAPQHGLTRAIAHRLTSNARREILSILAVAIVGYAVLSEISAVVSLYEQKPTGGNNVLTGTIFMILAAAWPPALAFWKSTRPRGTPDQKASTPPAPETVKPERGRATGHSQDPASPSP